MKPKPLSNLEQEVMEIVWEYNACSVRDVLQHLQKHKEYAYTTVATILLRLHKKGLVVKKEEKSGHIYSAKMTKESYSKNIAQSFLKRFITSFGNTGIASFADSIDKLPEEKRTYFLKRLDEHNKSK